MKSFLVWVRKVVLFLKKEYLSIAGFIFNCLEYQQSLKQVALSLGECQCLPELDMENYAFF